MDQVRESGVLRWQEGHSLVVMKVVGLAEQMMGERYMIGTYPFLRLHVLMVMTAVDVVQVETPVPPQMSAVRLVLSVTLNLLFQALSWRPTQHKDMEVVVDPGMSLS